MRQRESDASRGSEEGTHKENGRREHRHGLAAVDRVPDVRYDAACIREGTASKYGGEEADDDDGGEVLGEGVADLEEGEDEERDDEDGTTTEL